MTPPGRERGAPAWPTTRRRAGRSDATISRQPEPSSRSPLIARGDRGGLSANGPPHHPLPALPPDLSFAIGAGPQAQRHHGPVGPRAMAGPWFTPGSGRPVKDAGHLHSRPHAAARRLHPAGVQRIGDGSERGHAADLHLADDRPQSPQKATVRPNGADQGTRTTGLHDVRPTSPRAGRAPL